MLLGCFFDSPALLARMCCVNFPAVFIWSYNVMVAKVLEGILSWSLYCGCHKHEDVVCIKTSMLALFAWTNYGLNHHYAF